MKMLIYSLMLFFLVTLTGCGSVQVPDYSATVLFQVRDSNNAMSGEASVTTMFFRDVTLRNVFRLEYFNGTDWELVATSDLDLKEDILFETVRRGDNSEPMHNFIIDLQYFIGDEILPNGEYRILMTNFDTRDSKNTESEHPLEFTVYEKNLIQ